MNDARAVAVIDRVVLPAENATEWVDRMRAEYAPGAAERGMQLADSWWAYVGPDQIEVTLRWELPDSATFWAMRFAAAGMNRSQRGGRTRMRWPSNGIGLWGWRVDSLDCSIASYERGRSRRSARFGRPQPQGQSTSRRRDVGCRIVGSS